MDENCRSIREKYLGSENKLKFSKKLKPLNEFNVNSYNLDVNEIYRQNYTKDMLLNHQYLSDNR